MKALLVEDESRLATIVQRGLAAEGYDVMVAADGSEALRLVTAESFDVVLLDIMLPGLNGYEVLRRMRAAKVWTPVMMLTAKDGDYDQIDALDLGADDYLTKPFAFEVLVARVRALTRREATARPVVITAGGLSLDSVTHRVSRGTTVIKLTPKEFGVLEYLMRHRDTVVTKAEIRQNVWDPRRQDTGNIVEVYVGYLRRKVDDPFGTNTIQTVRGVGYLLNTA